MKRLSLSLLLLSLISCSEEREITNTVYLQVVAKDIKLAEKISKLILDDMSRFECVMPKDWNVKYDTKPCSKIVEYIAIKNVNYGPLDYVNTITILDGKNYRVSRKKFDSGILSLGENEEPNAINFAKKVITSPLLMIGYK